MLTDFLTKNDETCSPVYLQLIIPLCTEDDGSHNSVEITKLGVFVLQYSN